MLFRAIEEKNLFRYGIICALEELPAAYPVTLRGDIDEVAERAAGAGFDAVELHIRDPLSYDADELARAVKGRGLAFSGISTGLEYVLNGLSLISDDKGIRREAADKLKAHIDFAEKISCPSVVVGGMRGNIPDFSRYDEYEGRLTEAVLELSGYASDRPVTVLIESINRYVTNYLCSVPETLEYIGRLGRPNIRIHIDTHQMNIEDIDFGREIRACGERLGYVHFSDNNRSVPGGGNIDFLPVMRALYEISYTGFIGIESVEYPPGNQAVETSLAMLRGLESEIAADEGKRAALAGARGIKGL